MLRCQSLNLSLYLWSSQTIIDPACITKIVELSFRHRQIISLFVNPVEQSGLTGLFFYILLYTPLWLAFPQSYLKPKKLIIYFTACVIAWYRAGWIILLYLYKQAIDRFPQLVHHQAAAQQAITAGPIIQNCTPVPIRAPGEGGGAQPTRWDIISIRCDDRRLSRTRTATVSTRIVPWSRRRRPPISDETSATMKINAKTNDGDDDYQDDDECPIVAGRCYIVTSSDLADPSFNCQLYRWEFVMSQCVSQAESRFAIERDDGSDSLHRSLANDRSIDRLSERRSEIIRQKLNRDRGQRLSPSCLKENY